MSDSISSFVNGILAGAGAVLAFMSVAFLQFISPLENIQGVTTTEVRVAIFLGGIVCAVAVGYEFYGKKETKKKIQEKDQVEKDNTQEIKSDEKSTTTDE